MPTMKETLKREFNLEPAQFSPELLSCLARLEKLEADSEDLAQQMQGQLNDE